MYGTTSFPRKRMARNSSPMARDRISFRRFLFAVTMNASGSRMLFEPRENAYTLYFYESGVELVQPSQTVVPRLSQAVRVVRGKSYLCTFSNGKTSVCPSATHPGTHRAIRLALYPRVASRGMIESRSGGILGPQKSAQASLCSPLQKVTHMRDKQTAILLYRSVCTVQLLRSVHSIIKPKCWNVARSMHRIPGALSLVFALFIGGSGGPSLAVAAEPTPPRAGMTGPRTGNTHAFGSGTITNRSDGSSSRTQPFGSGSITTERGRDGKIVTGNTQKFGSGTITRWSDGTSSQTRPFGSGTITTEQGRNGQAVTGNTQKFGSGTITTRSDGSRSTSQPLGSGTIQRDQPGRK